MKQTTWRSAAVAVIAGATLAVPSQGAAAAPPSDPISPPHDSAVSMTEAMRRDLHLSDAQVQVRLRMEAAATPIAERLRSALGQRYAGAWVDGTELLVGVTRAADAAAVRAAGATPRVVTRSERQLNATKSALDSVAADAADAVRTWYVDPVTNTVVVAATSRSAGLAFVRGSTADPDEVTVRVTTETPRPVFDIRGGDQYAIGAGTLCSVGFAVAGGFVTAGHCGGAGAPTRGFNNVDQGTVAESVFPGNDYGWVRTNGSWASQPWVNNYAGGNVLVAGSGEAVQGSSVCRSGRTTGWRCGTITAKNVTVNYAQGAVVGLVRSSACAQPGDSGGAVISGNQAQGVTSGTTGNCDAGGNFFYQPITPILQRYGLSLTTTAGDSSRIVSNWHNKCIDVPNWNFSDGQRLIVWNCTDGTNQRWEFVGGTLRTQNNKCMDVAWGSTADGAAIQIATCSGNPAQQFVLSGAGDLVNPQANKCVDIKDWDPNNDAVLQLWTCNGGANQKWRRG
ncbi:ricin-type beta-trefoil lectin domain protein [Micromonospora sp. NPDC049580]|uniref:ricin-type beta-trefoil lectin domain protein n=1 Tax=Micromonospora sp. NPDC049580 TaxID=3154832 RepID=UPI0034305887